MVPVPVPVPGRERLFDGVGTVGLDGTQPSLCKRFGSGPWTVVVHWLVRDSLSDWDMGRVRRGSVVLFGSGLLLAG